VRRGLRYEYDLTHSEHEIYTLIRKRLTNKEIAILRSCEVATVKFHVTNIYRKVGVKTGGELIRRVGILPAEEPQP
jgi:DNA-binding CsgD family transcriptional regulator